MLLHIVLLLGSDKSQHCLCISNWLGMELYCIFSLCCTQEVPHQVILLFASPEAYLNPLFIICFSLSFSLSSLHELSSLSPLFLSYIHSATYVLLPLLRDHILPKTLIFLTLFSIPALSEISSLSEKHQQRERASMHVLKQRQAQQQTSHLLPFHSHPDP